jgi:hypothetical protein
MTALRKAVAKSMWMVCQPRLCAMIIMRRSDVWPTVGAYRSSLSLMPGSWKPRAKRRAFGVGVVDGGTAGSSLKSQRVWMMRGVCWRANWISWA